MPFAIKHKAVTSISLTAGYPDGGWLGYLKGAAWGLWIDEALLLVMGGIPWQVKLTLLVIL